MRILYSDVVAEKKERARKKEKPVSGVRHPSADLNPPRRYDRDTASRAVPSHVDYRAYTAARAHRGRVFMVRTLPRRCLNSVNHRFKRTYSAARRFCTRVQSDAPAIVPRARARHHKNRSRLAFLIPLYEPPQQSEKKGARARAA